MPSRLQGRRALIIAHSPFEAPALAARLAEAGAEITRAEGLEAGLGGAGGRAAARPRDRRLRARRRGDQPARDRRARGGRAEEPRPVLALRAARVRTEFAARFRWLAGQAGARAFAVRAAGERIPDRICAAAPRQAAAAFAVGDGRCSRRTTTSTRSSRKRRCAGSASRSTRARDGAAAARLADAAARGEAPRYDIVADGHQDAGPRRLRGRARDSPPRARDRRAAPRRSSR